MFKRALGSDPKEVASSDSVSERVVNTAFDLGLIKWKY